MVKKRHILFIVENASVPFDKRVWNEACAVRKLGHEVSVICPRDSRKPGDEDTSGIDIYVHPRPKDRAGKMAILVEYLNAIVWESLIAARIYLKKRFHVIHAANPPDHIFLIALPFKLLGVKFIFDHHDITPENFVAKFGQKGFLYQALMLMEKLTFLTSDVVISTNESYKRLAQGRGHKRADEVFVVRNGPDLERLGPLKPNEQLRNGFNYLVGYVGIISQQEGIDNLLRIADYLVNSMKRNDVKFIVIGSGPYWEQMVALCEKMGLTENVWFTGFVSDSKLYEILSTVDVCVNPEFRNEFTDKSTMIKIMEYMSFGKPIVQFYTTEGAVSAGESAVYVRSNSEQEFAEALNQLLEDPVKRARLGAEGRRRIHESLSWQQQSLNLKSAYEYVLGPS